MTYFLLNYEKNVSRSIIYYNFTYFSYKKYIFTNIIYKKYIYNYYKNQCKYTIKCNKSLYISYFWVISDKNNVRKRLVSPKNNKPHNLSKKFNLEHVKQNKKNVQREANAHFR